MVGLVKVSRLMSAAKQGGGGGAPQTYAVFADTSNSNIQDSDLLMDATTSYEIAFRFRTASANGSPSKWIFGVEDTVGDGVSAQIGPVANGRIGFYHNASSPATVTGANNIDDGLWHDVTIAWDGSNVTMTIDADVQIASATSAINATGLFLGNVLSGVPIGFLGDIDYFTITVNGSVLVDWQLNGDALDSSGNGNDGVVSNVTFA